MAGQFYLRFWLPPKSQGSFTVHAATWDRRLYFSSEGRHAVDFFVRKIRWLRPGSNPRSWVPEASMLTTRPQKPMAYCTNPALEVPTCTARSPPHIQQHERPLAGKGGTMGEKWLVILPTNDEFQA